MTTGERLKTLREKHGLSQLDIAEYLNVSKACISRYEIGNRSIPKEYLIKLAELFHTSVYKISIEEQSRLEHVLAAIKKSNAQYQQSQTTEIDISDIMLALEAAEHLIEKELREQDHDHEIKIVRNVQKFSLDDAYNSPTTGKKLKALRIKNNLSQDDIARYLSVSAPCVSRYELGDRRIPKEHLIKLADLFNTTIYDISEQEKTRLENIASAVRTHNELHHLGQTPDIPQNDIALALEAAEHLINKELKERQLSESKAITDAPAPEQTDKNASIKRKRTAKLNRLFSQLNLEGQANVLEYIKHMTNVPYFIENENESKPEQETISA